MRRIDRLYISPVKAQALAAVQRAYLDKPGIAGDRAFYPGLLGLVLEFMTLPV